jgi:large subunit ribosomal protein L6
MKKNELQKKTKINSLKTLSFAKISNNFFILFAFKSTLINYLYVPSFVKCELEKNNLIFSIVNLSRSQTFQYDQFLSQFQDYSKRLAKLFRKKLLLKGLGYKAALKNEESLLELKIGYSHVILVPIDKQILKVIIDKNTLIVEGFDKVAVGNFVNKIRSLKLPDSYKGKGFWYKNEIIKLKEINKT